MQESKSTIFCGTKIWFPCYCSMIIFTSQHSQKDSQCCQCKSKICEHFNCCCQVTTVVSTREYATEIFSPFYVFNWIESSQFNLPFSGCGCCFSIDNIKLEKKFQPTFFLALATEATWQRWTKCEDILLFYW